jgi:polar amino acid transport system substrate-binding protein
MRMQLVYVDLRAGSLWQLIVRMLHARADGRRCGTLRAWDIRRGVIFGHSDGGSYRCQPALRCQNVSHGVILLLHLNQGRDEGMEFWNGLMGTRLGLRVNAGSLITEMTECVIVAVMEFGLHRWASWRGLIALGTIILNWFITAGLAVAQSPLPASKYAAAANIHKLRGGWYPWDPYQYSDYRRGEPVLTGLDVEIERALARLLDVEIALPEVPWDDHLKRLAGGMADIAAGATENDARRAFAMFSKPYRRETDVLILKRGTASKYPFRTVDGMLATFAREKFRLGVVAGFVYADDRVNRFIADPANKQSIIATGSTDDNLSNLLDGVIDGYFADRIAAATTAWRRHQGALIEEHPVRFTTDIHLMLSRTTQTPEMLAHLDSAIDELHRSGAYRRIAASYALPILINQSLDSDWFRGLVVLGTVAFALSGVAVAATGRYSVFGAMILATLPGVGGGIVRDLLLQRQPIGIVQNPEGLLIVFGTVMSGMAVTRAMSRAAPLAKCLQPHAHVGARLVELFDAIGLAAFTVAGAVVVLDTQARPLWLWCPIAAVISGSFGGVMRDLFREDLGGASLRGALYSEIAAFWGLLFAVFLEWEGERLQPDEVRWGVIVTIIAVFLTRVVAIVRGIKGWTYI